LDRVEHRLEPEGFRDDLANLGPSFHVVRVRSSREDDDRDHAEIGVGVESAKEFIAARARHPEIEQDHARDFAPRFELPAKDSQSLRALVGEEDFAAFLVQDGMQSLANVRFVLDEENDVPLFRRSLGPVIR
jgi:hypothetical protein